jgi:PAS domain S-box-containing protein
MVTILVVDDLPANRQFLVTLLRQQGHRTLEAADGQEGLASVRTELPDLIITDVLMPVMDGYEFVRQLQRNPATSRIPIVFSTAHYGGREAKALALSMGVAYVLTKPAEPDEVLKVVDRVLSGELKTRRLPVAVSYTAEFDSEHLRLVTDTLVETTADLKTARARLRALVNIGLELASERNPVRLLESVCGAARDLFGATYVTLGMIGRKDQKLERLVTNGLTAANWIAAGDTVSGVLGEVVDDRRTLRGHNPGGDPTQLHLPRLHPEVRSFLVTPVASPAHVYGWLCIVGNEGRTFTAEDEELALALGGQVGRIYENGDFSAQAREERDRAQRYLDTAEVILLALDGNGRITLVNRHACAVLGWPQEQLVGEHFVEMCVPARLHAASTRQLSGGDGSVVNSAVLTRTGEERLIEWRTTCVRDAEGRIISTLSSGNDVTVRNQAVDALRSAEERMRFALESAEIGIWDMDCATGALQWSEILESQYGLGHGTFGGTFEAFAERIHSDDRAAVRETFEKAMKSGGDFSIMNRAVRTDGTVRWLSGAGRVLLGVDGEPLRSVGVSLDVTERRVLEDQYRQAQKMEAVGRLAGGVAHDFNNLLTVIMGYCELLLADFDLDDPRHGDILEIQLAGFRAGGLTRQLLAFSRRQIIEPVMLDLNVVATEMQTMLGRLIGEDVEVVVTLCPEQALVVADRGQVEQIVMNLAVNARDAMPHGGTLTLETAHVDLDANHSKTELGVVPGPYVALTMRDTGTGMTPEVQAQMFEPFFTTKEPGKGTGLGMATVYGIVARCGGSISVCSAPGKGTSFDLYFPRADADALAEHVPAPTATPRHGTQTVLVVEDEVGLRELAKRLLERQGYTVLLAAGADEALRLFEGASGIDILLTDVVMPGTSGPELTRRLVERQPGLKVIYMSGYTEDAIVQHGVLKPGIRFLNKPFTSETLGREIREALKR